MSSRRQCMFCGGPVETNEHTFPRWAVELMQRGRRSGTTEFQQGDGPAKKWPGVGRSAQMQVWHLCENCNGVRFGRLEGAVRPLIGGMMHDISILLDRDHQQLIAVWATKTAMVWEATTKTKEWFYSAAERRHLLDDLSPPTANTAIWLGRHTNPDVWFGIGRNLFRTKPVNDLVVPEGYVSTFAIGHLALQVFTIRRGTEDHSVRTTVHTTSGNWPASLIQIWPSGPPVRWPPRLSFREADLEALSTRFTRP